jgi:hypothetical protein
MTMTHYDRAYLAEPEFPKEDAYQAWVESEAGQDWCQRAELDLMAGKQVCPTNEWGISEPHHCLGFIIQWSKDDVKTLTPEQTDMMDDWLLYSQQACENRMASMYGDGPSYDQRALERHLMEKVDNHVAKLAERVVERLAENYFNDYVWKGK